MAGLGDVFFVGVGTGYILKKYHGDLLYGLKCVVAEYQRKAEVERRRVVDVFGDELRHCDENRTRQWGRPGPIHPLFDSTVGG